MKLNSKTLVLIASGALLSGCADLAASFTVASEMAGARVGQGPTPFAEALRREYSTRAQVEYDEAHDWEARYFAIKARQAAAGGNVLPAEMSHRKLPANMVDPMTQARARLIAALDGGGRVRQPDQAAKAQRGWDCWFEEQEENWQPNDIAACRKDFEDAMAQLAPAPAPPLAATPTPPAVPQPARDFIVYFDFDRTEIRSDAAAVLNQVLATYRQLGGANRTISLIGHADRSGDVPYNQTLSMRRADAVQTFIARQANIPIGLIPSTGRGETDPRVPTPDGVREQQNRRVELRIN